MNPGQSQEDKKSKSSTSYYLIGFFFLLIMGATWSLDNFFVYFSLGTAIFFFFLGFVNRPAQESKSNQYYQRDQKTNTQESGFEFFKKAFHQYQQQGTVKSPGTKSGVGVIIIAMIFIGGIFLVIFLSVIFSDDSFEAMSNYQKAENARYSEQYDSAMLFYRRALAEDPDHLDSWNGAGVIKMNQQAYDSAIWFFDRALEVDDDYEYARYNKALTYYYQKNYHRSLSETFSLMDHSPQYYDAMELAGNNYYDQQRYDSAEYWYQQGYDNGVRNSWLCHVLAYLNDKNGKSEKAIALYRETLNYDSSKVEVYDRLGEMLPGNEGNFFRSKASQLKSSQ